MKLNDAVMQVIPTLIRGLNDQSRFGLFAGLAFPYVETKHAWDDVNTRGESFFDQCACDNWGVLWRTIAQDNAHELPRGVHGFCGTGQEMHHQMVHDLVRWHIT